MKNFIQAQLAFNYIWIIINLVGFITFAYLNLRSTNCRSNISLPAPTSGCSPQNLQQYVCEDSQLFRG